MKTISIIAPATAVLLAACVSPPPPPPGSTLNYASAMECTGVFSSASAVTFADAKPTAILTENRDVKMAESPCYDVDGTKRPYVIYKLPTTGKIASIQAGSIPEPERLFASELVFLKADMTISRTVDKEAFVQRGSSWSALVRPMAGETHVAIVADPTLVGEKFSYVSNPEETSDTEEAAASRTLSPLMNVRVQKTSLPYSYEGKVFVRIYFADPNGMANL